MRDLRQLRKATGAALCVECGKCSSMCPLATFGGFSAARTMSMHDPAREMTGYAEAIERCLTCASCEVRCPQGVRYTDYVRGLRGAVPSECRRPRPHGEVFQRAGQLASTEETPARPSWLDDDLSVSTEGEIALFVGCLPIFDVVFSDDLQVDSLASARAAIRVLNRFGISPVLVGDECCCGHDLLWGGEREAFEVLAKANLQRFRERGIQPIVTVCAECCRTWRLDYPEVASDYRPLVEHMTEFLTRRLDDGELVFLASDNGAVTYQDPCRLGRQLDVLEQPRRLLTAIPDAELREMDRFGRDALCCGTSGFIHCDAVSRQLQQQRLQSAVDTGATRLLTACPKCQLHFRCAQAEDRLRGRAAKPIEVEDLTVFLADLLAPAESSPSGDEQEAAPTGERT